GGHAVFADFRTSGMYTISNCTVSVETASAMDGKAMFLGAQTHLLNVNIKRTDLNGNPALQVGDGGGNSILQNCHFGPVSNGSGILNNPDAGGTLTVTSWTFSNISGGRALFGVDRAQTWNVDKCIFGAGVFAIYAGNSASMPGTVFNVTRCLMGPAPT